MKRWQELYLRPAAAQVESLTWADGEIEGWARMELLEKGCRLMVEPVQMDLDDGTQITMAERALLECASFEADQDAWEQWRALHNTQIDALLYDPDTATIVCIFYNLRLLVVNETPGGESARIRVSAERAMKLTDGNLNVTMEQDLGEENPLRGIVIEGEMTAFEADIWQPSAVQSYGLEGLRLLYPIYVIAPTGFEISIDEASWADLLVLAKDYCGLIYVRLTGSVHGLASGDIEHTSYGVTEQDLAVSGTTSAEMFEFHVADPAQAVKEKVTGMSMSVGTPEDI